MVNAVIFWFISALLFFLEIKKVNKTKGIKDKVWFILMMLLAVILVSLHLLGIKLPYLVDIIDFVTKPVSEPLGKWLQSFQQS